MVVLGRLQDFDDSAARRYQERTDAFWNEVRDLNKLIGADYTQSPLKKALVKAMGDKTLAELEKQVLISSFDLDNSPVKPGSMRTWKPKFFQNFVGPGSDGQEKVIDVALRTSAAPTYFPIYQGYIDGGVVANNPSMCARCSRKCGPKPITPRVTVAPAIPISRQRSTIAGASGCTGIFVPG